MAALRLKYRAYTRLPAGSLAARSGTGFGFALSTSEPERNDVVLGVSEFSAEARANAGFAPTDEAAQGQAIRSAQNDGLEVGHYIGEPVDDPAATPPANLYRIVGITRSQLTITLLLRPLSPGAF